ncbi:LPP20 family lipoprotein [Marispirochaeta sp.]|uniref:LPP20 family lipoprotein n=1 Tax=Marispirochaeta sp. TaxID=2038653 RepID=UPI0029C64CE0|nr:LPP20 family lipoprotein [Marispirochaeta sp.]
MMISKSIIQSSLASLLMLILISCISSPEAPEPEKNSNKNTDRDYATWQDLRKPIVDQYELPPAEDVVPSPVPAPSWLPSRLPYWVWLPAVEKEPPLFLGTSFPRISRDKELEQCILNAARQAARYTGIAARFSTFRGTFREGTGYADDLRLYYNEELVPSLIGEAQIRTLHQDETGSYALIRFPSLLSSSAAKKKTFPVDIQAGTREPAWITTIPAQDDYYYGLGVSRPRIRFADSIADADQAALAEILLQLVAEVDVSYKVSTGENAGSSFQEDVYQYSSSTVRGFRIAARWRSPDGAYFYSLAVLPRE